MKKSIIKKNLNNLKLHDIYSLMLFILYQVENIPEYATLSRLCFLLDGNNLTRLLAHYGGQTLKIPTQAEFSRLTKALLLYQYMNLDEQTLYFAQRKIDFSSEEEKQEVLDLYLKILPIINSYDIDTKAFKNE